MISTPYSSFPSWKVTSCNCVFSSAMQFSPLESWTGGKIWSRRRQTLQPSSSQEFRSKRRNTITRDSKAAVSVRRLQKSDESCSCSQIHPKNRNGMRLLNSICKSNSLLQLSPSYILQHESLLVYYKKRNYVNFSYTAAPEHRRTAFRRCPGGNHIIQQHKFFRHLPACTEPQQQR